MKIRPVFIFVALFAPVFISPAAYLVAALVSGIGPLASVDALVEQSLRGRPNPLITGLLGIAPALLLLGMVFVLRKARPHATWVATAGWGGLGALLIVLAWANFEAWPLYLPGRASPGWPNGIELVIGPLIFGPIAVAAGMFLLGFVGGTRR
jgi:hypothetical protein